MKPKIVASECYSGLFPKNTLSGFKHCVDNKVDGIEFDVHLSADGHVVVQHDYTLNPRITRDSNANWLGKTGPALKHLTLNQIKSFNVGRYHPDSPEHNAYPNYQASNNERIPALTEFLDYYLAQKSQAQLWIELKTTPFQRDISANPQQLTTTVLDIINAAGVQSKTTLLAFEWQLLAEAKKACPEVQTDFLTINPDYIIASHKKHARVDPKLLYGQFNPAQHNDSIADTILAASGDWWGPYVHDVNKQQVQAAQHLGLKVNLWGVDSSSQAITNALDLGADAITLARPDLALNLIA